MSKYEDMFKYNSGRKLEEGCIRISPSGVKDLIKNRPHWINVNVLGNRKQDDMTNANIGTIIHAMIEENGNFGIRGGEQGVYNVKDGIIEQLGMTLDQFRSFVTEVVEQQAENTDNVD